MDVLSIINLHKSKKPLWEITLIDRYGKTQVVRYHGDQAHHALAKAEQSFPKCNLIFYRLTK